MRILKIILFTLVTITWGVLPVVAGVFYFLYNAITKNINKIRYVKGRIAVTTKDYWLGGVSLGLFYFVGAHDDLHTHYHEMGHTVQNLIWGPLFLFVIGFPSIIRAGLWDRIVKKALAKGKPRPQYEDIWFERQATQFGYKYITAYKKHNLGEYFN